MQKAVALGYYEESRRKIGMLSFVALFALYLRLFARNVHSPTLTSASLVHMKVAGLLGASKSADVEDGSAKLTQACAMCPDVEDGTSTCVGNALQCMKPSAQLGPRRSRSICSTHHRILVKPLGAANSRWCIQTNMSPLKKCGLGRRGASSDVSCDARPARVGQPVEAQGNDTRILVLRVNQSGERWHDELGGSSQEKDWPPDPVCRTYCVLKQLRRYDRSVCTSHMERIRHSGTWQKVALGLDMSICVRVLGAVLMNLGVLVQSPESRRHCNGKDHLSDTGGYIDPDAVHCQGSWVTQVTEIMQEQRVLREATNTDKASRTPAGQFRASQRQCLGGCHFNNTRDFASSLRVCNMDAMARGGTTWVTAISRTLRFILSDMKKYSRGV